MGATALSATEPAVSFAAVTPADGVSKIVLNECLAEQKTPEMLLADRSTVRPGSVTTAGGILRYLQEAMARMTGREVPVVLGGKNDLAQGIVLTTLENAPDSISTDPAILEALKSKGKDGYDAQEAYYIRSSPERLLMVANTLDGLACGVVELLESVGYEVLGMGPNWTHVPDYRTHPLVFTLNRSGRPGFYIRRLWATTAQAVGWGTLGSRIKLTDPADEHVQVSYERWLFGTRMTPKSMPTFPSHAMQAYHAKVIARMRDLRSDEGFLSEKTFLGSASERPPASPENKDTLWIDTDSQGSILEEMVQCSDGKKWHTYKLQLPISLDLSVPLVRQLILDEMKQAAVAHFEKYPDALLLLPTEPEDGSLQYQRIKELSRHPEWYPDALREKGIPFGDPYVLHGFKGLNQPREIWDASSPSDVVFGFNNWLLREMDLWIDSLPEEQRVTATGRRKKELLRASLLCYNFHDVPPNFNLDPRIRVKIADFPKNRGRGKWRAFSSKTDMAEAYRILLPREPAAIYEIWSLASYRDQNPENIEGSPSASALLREIRSKYDAGFRALSAEMDFNFGKYGLRYYMASKALWNPLLSPEEMEHLRDRWLQRSFGSAWLTMKQYYDLMTPERWQVNSPGSWAKAVKLLDDAGKSIDPEKEQAAARRINDVKQFWYFYYLVESGAAEAKGAELREFVWKGQMSYMTAMVMVTRTFFDRSVQAAQVAGSDFNNGPAHYRDEETRAWWAKVMSYWPPGAELDFVDSTLIDGKPAKDVDLNNLVRVAEFQAITPGQNILVYDHTPQRGKQATFLTIATAPEDMIGFSLFWPAGIKGNRELAVSYGAEHWNASASKWEGIVDYTTERALSTLSTSSDGKEWHLVQVQFPAPQSGTYRFQIGIGGVSSHLAALDFNLPKQSGTTRHGQTYTSAWNIGAAQASRPCYFYIPKGTTRLDIELHRQDQGILSLYTGLPSKTWRRSRIMRVKGGQLHSIELTPEESGSVAVYEGRGFPRIASIPQLWAKHPSALLVPAAIATADGLTPIDR